MRLKRIILIILTILWMGIIFSFSSENSDKSSNTSGRTIRAIVRIFVELPQQREDEIVEQLQHITRKIAHFTIYTIGGVILINLVKTYTMNKPWIYAWGIGTMYAITDEIHQYFVPGRSCQVTDVLLDSCGVITGILFVIILLKIIKGFTKNIDNSNIKSKG